MQKKTVYAKPTVLAVTKTGKTFSMGCQTKSCLYLSCKC